MLDSLVGRVLGKLTNGVSADQVNQADRELGGMLAPILKLPVETALGTQFFTGRELGRQKRSGLGRLVFESNAPKALKDWLGAAPIRDTRTGVTEYTLNEQRYRAVMEIFGLSRLLSATDKSFDRMFKQFDASLKKGESKNLARFVAFLAATPGFNTKSTTGMETEVINLDEEKLRKLRERKRALQQLLIDHGLGRELELFRLDPDLTEKEPKKGKGLSFVP
jgi:hypothetical protein